MGNDYKPNFIYNDIAGALTIDCLHGIWDSGGCIQSHSIDPNWDGSCAGWGCPRCGKHFAARCCLEGHGGMAGAYMCAVALDVQDVGNCF